MVKCSERGKDLCSLCKTDPDLGTGNAAINKLTREVLKLTGFFHLIKTLSNENIISNHNSCYYHFIL